MIVYCKAIAYERTPCTAAFDRQRTCASAALRSLQPAAGRRDPRRFGQRSGAEVPARLTGLSERVANFVGNEAQSFSHQLGFDVPR